MSDNVITVYDVEELPTGPTLQVISRHDVCEGEKFFVRLKEGDEHEDTPFEDYPQAAAHWRNVLRSLGVVVAYHAPQAQAASQSTANPTRTWLEVYYDFHSQLSGCKVGTPEATAVRDRFMADPEFADHVVDILGSCVDRHDWMSATIRTACKRVMAREKLEGAKAIEETLSTLPTFGAF